MTLPYFSLPTLRGLCEKLLDGDTPYPGKDVNTWPKERVKSRCNFTSRQRKWPL